MYVTASVKKRSFYLLHQPLLHIFHHRPPFTAAMVLLHLFYDAGGVVNDPPSNGIACLIFTFSMPTRNRTTLPLAQKKSKETHASKEYNADEAYQGILKKFCHDNCFHVHHSTLHKVAKIPSLREFFSFVKSTTNLYYIIFLQKSQ